MRRQSRAQRSRTDTGKKLLIQSKKEPAQRRLFYSVKTEAHSAPDPSVA